MELAIVNQKRRTADLEEKERRQIMSEELGKLNPKINEPKSILKGRGGNLNQSSVSFRDSLDDFQQVAQQNYEMQIHPYSKKFDPEFKKLTFAEQLIFDKNKRLQQAALASLKAKEEENNQDEESQTLRIDFSQLKSKPQSRLQSAKSNKTTKSKFKGVTIDENDEFFDEEQYIRTKFPNPFDFNEGDVDLELYFKPLFSQIGEKMSEIPLELLRHYNSLRVLTVLGVKIWTAIHSENWRHREAAAQAVLNFMEMPLVSLLYSA